MAWWIQGERHLSCYSTQHWRPLTISFTASEQASRAALASRLALIQIEFVHFLNVTLCQYNEHSLRSLKLAGDFGSMNQKPLICDFCDQTDFPLSELPRQATHTDTNRVCVCETVRLHGRAHTHTHRGSDNTPAATCKASEGSGFF